MKRALVGLLVIGLIACESAADKADRFFLKGNVALNEGRLEEAVRMYNEAIDKNPSLKEAYNNKGVALYRDGKLEEAIDTYTDLLFNVDAYYMEARRNRLDAYLDNRDMKNVAKELKFFQDAYPDSSWVYMLRGIAMIKTKSYGMARLNFARALEMEPDNAENLVNIANTYYYLKRHDDATVYLDSALKVNPDLASIYNTKSMIASSVGNYERALEHSNKAISLDPTNPYFYNNRGFAQLKLGALDEAERDIDIAIRGDIYNGWAYKNKGIFYNLKGDYESALRNFQLAVKYDSAVEQLHSYYGDALYELGRTDEACKQWKISFDLFENEGRESLEKFCK